MICNEMNNEVFLNMVIRKSFGKTDEDGNYVFEVEASNENLDLQGQVVLQQALLGSKEHFLKDGVVSFDHLHKRKDETGKIVSDPEMIIGEPIEVKTEGKKTIVVGKLYKSNKIAQDIIQKLKDKSTRVKASVGGIFPQVVKDTKTGVEKIVSVLWNDLALTFSPVNATVEGACFAKSMEAPEFVKALMAQGGTDHAQFSGGRPLIPEQVGRPTVDVTESDIAPELKDTILRLMAALHSGEITGQEQAVKYLEKQGLDTEQARIIVREITLFTEERV